MGVAVAPGAGADVALVPRLLVRPTRGLTQRGDNPLNLRLRYGGAA